MIPARVKTRILPVMIPSFYATTGKFQLEASLISIVKGKGGKASKVFVMKMRYQIQQEDD